jgi:hypothetical protein
VPTKLVGCPEMIDPKAREDIEAIGFLIRIWGKK